MKWTREVLAELHAERARGKTQRELAALYRVSERVIRRVCEKHFEPKNARYTAAQDAKITELWAEGKSTNTISKIMNITKNAVVGKAHRLNLPARPSPIKTKGSGEPRRRDVVRRVREVPRLTDLTGAAVTVTAGIFPTWTAPQPPTPLVTPDVALPPAAAGAVRHPCCFPMWPHKARPDMRFCGREAVADRPYCADHFALCYNQVRERAA